MDDFLRYFFPLSFLLILLPLASWSVSNLNHDLVDVPRIDRFVFDHDVNVARSEQWDVYLDGSLVPTFSVDFYSSSYVVSFDYFNKVVVITTKVPYPSSHVPIVFTFPLGGIS